MIILNFKNYPESTNRNGYHLLEKISQIENKKILELVKIAVPQLDLIISKKDFPELNIISQNVDNFPIGKSTGWIIPENLINYNIEYSLYNHSEHRVNPNELIKNIKEIESRGIKLIVCCENIEEAERILEAQPYAIAYEPKEFIGTQTSVTTQPEIINKFLSLQKNNTKLLIGAGINLKSDIEEGQRMGSEGFLISSSFVKSSDPIETLISYTSPLL